MSGISSTLFSAVKIRGVNDWASNSMSKVGKNIERDDQHTSESPGRRETGSGATTITALSIGGRSRAAHTEDNSGVFGALSTFPKMLQPAVSTPF